MITPRVTRLLRAADLRARQRTVVSILPRHRDARACAVIVPTRSAADALRRTIEDLRFGCGEAAFVLADFVTRDELYRRLHASLGDAPPLLTEFEREVLLRLAASEAEQSGIEAPFRLRPGLLAAMVSFYDDLHRRGRSLDAFDRSVREKLEAVSDTDRGARRLLTQTLFLTATLAAFERRVADSGRVDEHAVRSLLLSSGRTAAWRHVVVAVADQAADPRGLWPADFDLLSRLPGLERLDVVLTERELASGLHQRLHDALPGIDEQRLEASSLAPTLVAPEAGPGEEPRAWFVCRDREEELVEAARTIKMRVRDDGAALDRTAIVFQRPLPYLYLARQVFASARMPCQAVDSLPLAAEPFAAAMDLVFTVAVEEATRTALVELLGSPHWAFIDPASAPRPLDREHLGALDRVLQESKYLGGWDRLAQLAAESEITSPDNRRAGRRRGATGALRAAVAVGAALEPVRRGASAADQLSALLAFVAAHERLPRPDEAHYERHLRARGAVLGALSALRDAHARHDDRPLPVADLIATIRRWIEGQTFAPRMGENGLLLLDAPAAAFANVDEVRLVGLVDTDWPEPTTGSIFYPAALLRDLGWPPESDRLAAARARFQDLLELAGRRVSVSTFTLEEDALVSGSPFLEDVATSGLLVERPPSLPVTRIFEHEALAIEPIAAAAVSGRASDWLQHRLGRTPALDPRYRGSVGAREPDVYAVSRVERYLECPFKYFAGHILRLDEEREDESGLTPQERGQLLHGVFEAFFSAWRGQGRGAITLANVAEASTLFAQITEAQLAALPEADRALERTYLLGSAASPGLAERAFAFEIEQGVEVVDRLLEHAFEGEFRFDGTAGPRTVRLRGKADRIDLLADGTLRIVDYKLGRAPKPGRALQLPVYGVCARQQLDGRLGRSWTLARAGYLAFREKNAFVELGGRGGTLDSAVREGEQRFLDAIQRIESGEFPPSPDEAWTCTRCGFPHVCRKDYVGDE